MEQGIDPAWHEDVGGGEEWVTAGEGAISKLFCSACFQKSPLEYFRP